MAYANEFGAKYEATKDLSRADLKKAIVADLKAAVKNGDLPKCKITLANPHYSSFRVTIREASFAIVNPGFVKRNATRPTEAISPLECPRYTDEAQRVLDRVTAIVDAYNYDRSDIQTDYFDVRFYLDVNFASADVEAETRKIIDAASPLRAKRASSLHCYWAVTNDWLAENGHKVMDAWRKTDPSSMRQAITKALGVEAFEGLAREVAEIDAKLAAGDDWNTEAGATCDRVVGRLAA